MPSFTEATRPSYAILRHVQRDTPVCSSASTTLKCQARPQSRAFVMPHRRPFELIQIVCYSWQ